MGLKQQIMKAKTETEIAALHEKGATYVYASPKTHRQWARKAHARRSELLAASAKADHPKPAKKKAVKA